MTKKGKSRTRNARTDIVRADKRHDALKARQFARDQARYNRQAYDGHSEGEAVEA